jgi:hypothetical protein
MSFNGSGIFDINSFGQPVVPGTLIEASVFNLFAQDIATGLSTTITRDGRSQTTVRIPFAFGINSSLVDNALSANTGSIISQGGIGVAKDIFCGGKITALGGFDVTGATTFAGLVTFNAGAVIAAGQSLVGSATGTISGFLSVAATTGTFTNLSINAGGGAVVGIKQSNNTHSGGLRSIRSDSTQFLSLYVGGDDAVYLQNNAGASSYISLSSAGAVTIPGTLGVAGAITGASYSGGAISGTTGLYTGDIIIRADADRALRFQTTSAELRAYFSYNYVGNTFDIVASNTGMVVNTYAGAEVGPITTVSTTGLAVTGTGAFSGAVTVATTTTGNKVLNVGASPADNSSSAINLLGSSSAVNWQIGMNNTGGGFNIIPSTAAGGSTFTTPVFNLTAAGATVTGTLSSTGAISSDGYLSARTALATPAGGSLAGVIMGSAAIAIYFGSGAPTVAAVKGSLYLRTDGSTTNDRMYVNTNGSTTWTAVTTAV